MQDFEPSSGVKISINFHCLLEALQNIQKTVLAGFIAFRRIIATVSSISEKLSEILPTMDKDLQFS